MQHGNSSNSNRNNNIINDTNNGNTTNCDTVPQPCMVREQDQYMPIANVIRIMRRILPAHAKISDDAKETIQECVSEYISFITGEANERCQREQRKTITAEDVLWAMGKLGFDDYVEPLTVFLSRYRENENERTSLRGEPILKRGIDYGQMMMAPYGPAFHMGHHQGMFDAAATAMGGYFRDASGAAGSSSPASLTKNFDPFGQFK
ncbi:nuclear transcription factor Y subunit B-9-like [Durio zibethinus]|uniref:Nuclear transcription factor Y subunit B-9-like n=1 Tax=Durio zibethinus TaxID=66656 RepID=A0A6P5WLG2_DURZI|nr:nuclear transcription factor Y subunit B-9-like [Durio zibethinus]